MKKNTADRLIVALGLALQEIHNPGANRAAGIDIVALCEGVLKQATGGQSDIPAMAREELTERASS